MFSECAKLMIALGYIFDFLFPRLRCDEPLYCGSRVDGVLSAALDRERRAGACLRPTALRVTKKVSDAPVRVAVLDKKWFPCLKGVCPARGCQILTGILAKNSGR